MSMEEEEEEVFRSIGCSQRCVIKVGSVDADVSSSSWWWCVFKKQQKQEQPFVVVIIVKRRQADRHPRGCEIFFFFPFFTIVNARDKMAACSGLCVSHFVLFSEEESAISLLLPPQRLFLPVHWIFLFCFFMVDRLPPATLVQ